MKPLIVFSFIDKIMFACLKVLCFTKDYWPIFNTHVRNGLHSAAAFSDLEFSFWKPWSVKRTPNTTGTKATVSVPSLAVCLQSSDGGLWGWATCEMKQCASWSSQWLERQMVMVVWSRSVLVIHQQQVKNSYYSLCEAGCRFFQCWESFPSVEWI